MFFYILIGKFITLLINFFRLGSGSTWPGHLILELNKKFISQLLRKNPHLIKVVVAGTNGKTTTVALIKFVLKSNGYSVLTNQEGANLLNGLASTLIRGAGLDAKIRADVLVFEADEFSFPYVVKEMSPEKILILNLFRDQLDRYGEVNTIIKKWFESLKNLKKTTEIYLNINDPQLYFLGKSLKGKIFFFGLDKDKMLLKKVPHDVDFNYCPVCYSILRYDQLAYAHLGFFYCPKCGFTNKKEEIFREKVFYPLEGLYNQYNTNAVVLLLKKGFSLSISKINHQLKKFLPAFGRQEIITYKNKDFFILLSKNPAGFNQSIKTITQAVKKNKVFTFLVLNDRVPDGKDVSWIWDVDFADLFLISKKIVVSGDRGYDLAIRLKYESKKLADEEKIIVFEKNNQAIDYLVKQTKTKEKIFVLPTYSAMLELRKILVGKKFL